MPNDDRVEHFLVDGVAPPVIGGGPPESPFDLEPDPEPHQRQARGHLPSGAGHAPPGAANSGPPYGQPPPQYGSPVDREPPTSPIPAIAPLPPEPEKRKSWLAKMFRSPGS